VGPLVKGDVVVVPFPFSDLSNTKKRPALVVVALPGNDNVLCMISTKAKWDNYSIGLEDSDFQSGSLRHSSIVRPNRLFTAHENIISYTAGKLHPSKIEEVEKVILAMFTA